VHDIELKYVADILVKVNAKAFSIESANVRHEHEWQVWRDVKSPDGRINRPGVISHATDLVEHPQVVADRIVNFASVLGKENVQTGTDCGIESRVGHEEIVWVKLRSMSEGARLALRSSGANARAKDRKSCPIGTLGRTRRSLTRRVVDVQQGYGRRVAFDGAGFSPTGPPRPKAPGINARAMCAAG